MEKWQWFPFSPVSYSVEAPHYPHLPAKTQIRYPFSIPAAVILFPQPSKSEKEQYCHLFAAVPSSATRKQPNIPLEHILCSGHIEIWMQDTSHLLWVYYSSRVVKITATPVHGYLWNHFQSARPYQRRFHMGLSCSSINVFISDQSDGRRRLHCMTLLLKPSWERWENTATWEQLCWEWPTNWKGKTSITPQWKVHLSSTLAPMFSPPTLWQFHPLSLMRTVLFGASQSRRDVNPQKRLAV